MSFTYRGKRCRETLAWTPNATNEAAAARLVKLVREEVELERRGIAPFKYEKHFPESERAKAIAAAATPAPKVETFGDFADAYAAALDLAPATTSQYANELKRWKQRIGAAKPIAEIRHSWLTGVVGKVKFPSASMRNNSLIPLRGAFALWVADDPRVRVNPMDGIENGTVQKRRPDPFEREEAVLIVDDMKKHYGPLLWGYYVLEFFAGLRPEEAIAFRWEKMDWRRRGGVIDRVRTFKGGEREVKTKKVRFVHFNSMVMAALRELRSLTELKPHKHVLENPVTGRPWHDERSQRDHYWKPTLRRLHLRYRPPYQTRATRATMMLMAGMNPAYCTKQLGNSKRVFFETYADWIELAEKMNDRERAKDEAELERPVSEEKAG